jgi:hypothetical protein
MHRGDALEERFEKRARSRPIAYAAEIGDDGLVLGAGTILTRMTGDSQGESALDLEESEDRVIALLAAAHGRPMSADLPRHLDEAFAHWRRGEKALANIRLAFARIPRLDDRSDAYRLFLAEELLNAGMSEDDEAQIAALQDAIVRLKDFIVAEISEDDEDDEQPSDILEQAASPRDFAKISETLEAARLERDAQKALLAELAPRLEKLGQRVEKLARQPLPPPMLAGTRAVEKGAEARVEDLAAMTGEQRAALLIKVAQSQPRALR